MHKTVAPTPIDTHGATPSLATLSLAQAAKFWFKLGLISFGGPAGQIATVHQELVEKKRWISEKRFLHALNYCMILPGPEALQLVIYIGWLLHRGIGGLIAGLLFILPALFLLIALSWIYVAFGATSLVAGVFFGLKPAVTAIVLQAAHRIGKKILHHTSHWAIACATFVGITLFNISYPVLIIGAAIAGHFISKKYPEFIQSGGQAQSQLPQSHSTTAIIDDDTASPEHARFSVLKVVKVSIFTAIAWLVPFLLSFLIWGKNSLYTKMAWFFTKAALLTFGGAYAVLPYVYQGAVDHFHWLTAAQMMDGLALGETTPGPLILVVAFVGYMAGQTSALVGESPFVSGALGAALVSWFIFLPSFCLIFLGGPLIESTHRQLKFTAPLTGITSAVVGVISSLTMFFAIHTFWPSGYISNPSYVSIVIFAGAAFAFMKLKRGIFPVMLACGVAGLIWTLVSHGLGYP